MGRFLIVGDVDRIQAYVFGSPRLLAIRGASALLGAIAKELKECIEAKGGKCLRYKGGQLVAILENGDPDLLCAELEQIIRNRSGGAATITTAYVSYDGAFKDAVSEAFKKIRLEKEGRQVHGPSGPMLGSSAYERHCDLCQRLPASINPDEGRISWRPAPDEPARYLCEACWRRIEGVKHIDFDKDLIKEMHKQGAAWEEEVTLPYRIQDLWPEEEGRFMALISADGNSFGQILETINDEKLYQKFSDKLYALTIEAMASAAKNELPQPFPKPNESGRVRHLLPFMPIILGGDDFSILLPAEYALPFTRAFCEAFAEGSMRRPAIQQVISQFRKERPDVAEWLFPNRGSAWLTLSAGVAMAKPHFPISAYQRLAGQLRANAKRALRSYPSATAEGGMMDFALITTATVQELTKLRKRYELDDGTHLTARPYTLAKFRLLEKLRDALCEIPRSKRKFLYAEFWRGRASGIEAYKFVLKRELRAAPEIHNALRNLGCTQLDHHPFDEDNRTPLLDALEIADLRPE
jgi:GGDEF domain-containing protein